MSTCCEYKHKAGRLLGSKTSHFMFVSVTGAQPCYKCQVEAELTAREDRKKQRQEQNQKKEEQHDQEPGNLGVCDIT